jgi:hypothetical protein
MKSAFFWDTVLNGFDQDIKAVLLQIVMGISVMPVNGFSSISTKIKWCFLKMKKV